MASCRHFVPRVGSVAAVTQSAGKTETVQLLLEYTAHLPYVHDNDSRHRACWFHHCFKSAVCHHRGDSYVERDS